MPRAVVALLVVLGLVLPGAPRTIAAPTDGWPTAAPEEQGIDSAKLADALLAMQQQVPNLHGFLLIRDGKIVVDASFYPYDGTTPHDLASVTKSVMTTLIGIAIDQGKLSLDDPVLSFFPDRTIANLDDRKEQMTVADLASMTSGLDCVWQPDEPTLREMEASDDMVQFTLDLPMVAEPGTTWEYCSPGMHLLSAILTEATGTTALDFAYDTLFGPLGMREVIWPADQNGYNHGWGDLMLYPREAAKLGQLWLNGGTWNGRQIVSPDWVEAAVTAKATTTEDGQDYGYGWWITREGAVGQEFSARGRGGQYVVVFPAFKALAMITGSGDFGPSDVTDLLLPALVDPTKAIPANPEGMARLTETVAGLSAAPDPTPVPPLPATALEISGKTYTFEANPLGIVSVRLDFDQSAEAMATFALEGDPGPVTLAVGLDGIFRTAPGDYGFPLGLRGAWSDPSTFVLDYDMIANNDALVLELAFADATVTITASERTHEGEVQFQGTAIAQ
jgi:CubicO group peptidase (beta-lactamase class C family)